jgi:hypothetical protein
MNQLRAIYSLAVALCSLTSNTAIAAAGWTDSTPITELNQQPTSGVGSTLVFVETTATVNPSGCSHTTGFYFAVTDDRTKRMFAMLMSAQLAGRNVKIYTTGICHSPWNYAQLDGVVINQ